MSFGITHTTEFNSSGYHLLARNTDALRQVFLIKQENKTAIRQADLKRFKK